MIAENHNPDVLSCLANLSNDEVFTPPRVVNQMLDLLPQELFENPDTTFLDPACKTGVFLREIAKRLIKGLEAQIPDLQERLDHIFHKQLFGIAITELTSLLARRGVYCSKYANSPYAVSRFQTTDGNIRFQSVAHTWKNGKCIYCGASQTEYDRTDKLETHAYEFIHPAPPPRHCERSEAIHPTKEFLNMKFDVIIGNPPYQLSTGGSKAQAIPLYNKFIEKAKKLAPRYLTMIIPDRWFSGGFGLNEFRNDMLTCGKLEYIYNYPIASECFPGVDIPGGVCYFLWNRDYEGDCIVTTNVSGVESLMKRPLLERGADVFVKYNEAVSILRKVQSKNEKKIIDIVSSQKPFGLPTTFQGGRKGELVVIGRNQQKSKMSQMDVAGNVVAIDKWKVFISAAYGERVPNNLFVLGTPFVGSPKEVCTETYIFIGAFDDKNMAVNLATYVKTKFFRFLVLLHKPTQHALRNVYSFVPLQDFSKPWTDKELYKKYNLSQDEIAFIESMIRPME